MTLRSFLFFAFAAGAAVAGINASGAAETAATTSPSLDGYLWRQRVLLIMTPALNDARYERQAAALLPFLPELAQREVQIVVALPGDPRRARFGPEPRDFLVALVGLDGGIKLTRSDLLTPQALTKEIDSMPLRRSELKSAERERHKGTTGAPLTATEVRNRLQLSHPAAGGGWEDETLRDGNHVTRTWLFERAARPSNLRTYRAGAVLTLLGGDPVQVLALRPDGTSRVLELASGVREVPAAPTVVQAGETVSIRLRAGGTLGWALLSETSSGSAAVTDSDLPSLAAKFPAQAGWISETAATATK